MKKTSPGLLPAVLLPAMLLASPAVSAEPCPDMAPAERRVCLNEDLKWSNGYLADLERDLGALLEAGRKDAFVQSQELWRKWQEKECGFVGGGNALDRLVCQSVTNGERVRSLAGTLGKLRNDPPESFDISDCYASVEAMDAALEEGDMPADREKVIGDLVGLAIAACEGGNPNLGMKMLGFATDIYDE